MDIFNEIDIDSLCGHCVDFFDELKQHSDDSSIINSFVKKMNFFFSNKKYFCGCSHNSL